MLLVKRLRIVREARQSIEAAMASGLSAEDAGEAMLADMRDKYAGDKDWLTILEIILKLLALFL